MSEPSSKKLKVNNNNTTQKEQIKYVLEEINLIPKNEETKKLSIRLFENCSLENFISVNIEGFPLSVKTFFSYKILENSLKL